MKVKIYDRDQEMQELLADLSMEIEYNDQCDICMLNVDHYALSLLEKYQDSKIILILESIEHLHEALEIQNAIIIKKPFELNYVCPILEKIYFEINDSLIIKHKKNNQRIYYNEISFIASDKRKIIIYMKNGKKIEEYAKLDELEKVLPDYFIRIHKSYLINFKDLKEYSSKEVFLYSYPFYLNVSRSRCHEMTKKIRKLISMDV